MEVLKYFYDFYEDIPLKVKPVTITHAYIPMKMLNIFSCSNYSRFS